MKWRSTFGRARLWALVIVAILALVQLGLALPALAAQDPGGGEVPTFDAFLQLVSGPWVSAAVAIILSWVVEYVPAYENLLPKWKRIVYFGASLLVPISAALLRVAIGYAPLSWDPLLWHAVWNGAAAGGIGTLVHTRELPTEAQVKVDKTYLLDLQAQAAKANDCCGP